MHTRDNEKSNTLSWLAIILSLAALVVALVTLDRTQIENLNEQLTEYTQEARDASADGLREAADVVEPQ